jgi:tRNA(Met) cytidine acetyltransferase
LCNNIKEYVKKIRENGYRGLLVLEVNEIKEIENIGEIIFRQGTCLAITTKNYKALFKEKGCEVFSPLDLKKVLGREYDIAVIALDDLIRPNVIAGVAGTVKGGGILSIILSRNSLARTKNFKKYFMTSICRAENVLWLDLVNDEVKCSKVAFRTPPKRRIPNLIPGVPEVIARMVITSDQAKALKAILDLMKGKWRSLLIYGDRGRGKSYIIGLALATGIKFRLVGRVTLTAPDPWNVQVLMKGVLDGLKALEISRIKISRNRSGAIMRVSGPWFKLSYESPESLEASPLVIIDEAAAVGIARVRRISWKAPQIVASTTVHGYEGSGRAMLHLVEEVMPRPFEKVEMKEPIRYPPDDPLEKWTYEVFHLRPEPRPLKNFTEINKVRYRLINKEEMSSDLSLASKIMELLALAHYRNEPDDLLILLDAENHTVHILEDEKSNVVAAADVAVETEDLEEPAKIGLSKLYNYTTCRGLKAARVVRIAVHPDLQRRGLGSLLLRKIEAWAREEGADVVLSIFSRHEVLGFWFKNGYKPFYISPRYNKVTGEKNIAVAKGITSKGIKAVSEASKELRLRLLLSSFSIYRDLAAEKVVEIIDHSEKFKEDIIYLKPSESSGRRLKLYLEGILDYEQVSDIVYVIISRCLLTKNLSELLNRREAIAVVARVLQGKPLDEVSKILSEDLENTNKEVNEAIKRVLKVCLPPELYA